MHVVAILFCLPFVPYPKLFVEVGEGVPKGSVWVQYDVRIVSSPMFVGKDGKETLGECLVHVHALCVVLLLILSYLADEGVGDSGAVIVVWWRISWICRWCWILVGCVAGVVLTHGVWYDQEELVEVTVVGDMLLGAGDHVPEDAEEFALRGFSDDSLDGCREAGNH